MRNIIRTMITVSFILMMQMVSFAATYSISGVNRNDQITTEQFDQILNTLRDIKDNNEHGDYDFYDTGLRCDSREEAEALMSGFEELFLADDHYILEYNYLGCTEMYVKPERNSNGGYTFTYSGRGGNKHAILAVWYPDADENELLRQHDEASQVVCELIGTAPENPYDQVKYYNDVLSERISYDWDGYNAGNGKHSPYYGLVEGTCVCSGYAEAFYNLCYYSGINCAVSSCVTSSSTDGTANHKIAMVNLDGRWKEVDVTWNDMDPGIRYDYFMVDMNEKWQQHINSPYMIKTSD